MGTDWYMLEPILCLPSTPFSPIWIGALGKQWESDYHALTWCSALNHIRVCFPYIVNPIQYLHTLHSQSQCALSITTLTGNSWTYTYYVKQFLFCSHNHLTFVVDDKIGLSKSHKIDKPKFDPHYGSNLSNRPARTLINPCKGCTIQQLRYKYSRFGFHKFGLCCVLKIVYLCPCPWLSNWLSVTTRFQLSCE